MAEADWTVLSGGLDANSVSRGVITTVSGAPVAEPNGGGDFVFGFNSKVATAGAVGYHVNVTTFSPLRNDAAQPTGGSIRGCIMRGVSAGTLDFAPMLFIGLQLADVTAQGYLLGLSDSDPHAIVLRKGAPTGGLDPTSADILRTSTGTYAPGTWLHLRLDLIVNPNGDSILQCWQSDLDLNLVTNPNWVPIAGITDYVDDALGINSGSTPFAGEYAGMAFQSNNISRRAYFDHIQLLRQV